MANEIRMAFVVDTKQANAAIMQLRNALAKAMNSPEYKAAIQNDKALFKANLAMKVSESKKHNALDLLDYKENLRKKREAEKAATKAATAEARKAATDQQGLLKKAFGGKVADPVADAARFSLAAIAGVAGAGIAVVAKSIKEGAQASRDLSKGLKEVNTLMPDGTNMESFRKQIIAIGNETNLNAETLTKPFYDLISASVPAEESMRILRESTMAAQAGLGSSGDAVNAVTNAVNAYGKSWKDSGEIFDTVQTAIRIGKTSMAEFSGQMSQYSMVSAQVGGNFKADAAAIATLTKQGKGTAEASTALGGFYTAMLKNQDRAAKMGPKVAEAFSFQALEAKGLQKFMVDLADALDNDKTKMTELLGRAEATSVMLGLTGQNAKMAADDMLQFANNTGEMNKAFDKVHKGSNIKKLQTNLHNLGITIYDRIIPAVSALAGIVINLIDFFKEHNTITTFALSIGVASAAVWALNASMGTLSITSIKTLIPALMKAVAGFQGMATAANASLGVIGLVAGAIVALGFKMAKWWDEIQDMQASADKNIQIQNETWQMAKSKAAAYKQAMDDLEKFNQVTESTNKWLADLGEAEFKETEKTEELNQQRKIAIAMIAKYNRLYKEGAEQHKKVASEQKKESIGDITGAVVGAGVRVDASLGIAIIKNRELTKVYMGVNEELQETLSLHERISAELEKEKLQAQGLQEVFSPVTDALVSWAQGAESFGNSLSSAIVGFKNQIISMMASKAVSKFFSFLTAGGLGGFVGSALSWLGFGEGYASGGVIHAAGGTGVLSGGISGRDSIPILAMSGEAVLNRNAVRRVGGADGINALNNGGSLSTNPLVINQNIGYIIGNEQQAVEIQRTSLARSKSIYEKLILKD